MGRKQWTRIAGDGAAYKGPCLLTDILVHPDANNDMANVYDGIDPTAGKPFATIEPPNGVTAHLHFGNGIPFDRGIYIDGTDSAVITTVVFIPISP